MKEDSTPRSDSGDEVEMHSLDCHPEQAFVAQRKPGLSGVEGDLGEPREVSCSLRRNKRVARFLTKTHRYRESHSVDRCAGSP